MFKHEKLVINKKLNKYIYYLIKVSQKLKKCCKNTPTPKAHLNIVVST